MTRLPPPPAPRAGRPLEATADVSAAHTPPAVGGVETTPTADAATFQAQCDQLCAAIANQ